MLQQATTVDARLLVRKCVACGYDGELLRNGAAVRCARCGCDLRKRPPKSYAEMEGLIGQPFDLDAPPNDPPRNQRFIRRWIAFLFLTAICIMVLIQLAEATFDF